MCPCELTEDPETMRPHLEAGRALNVSLFFVSVKAGDALSKPEAYRRLRGRADLAAEYGITLSLETHPTCARTPARPARPWSGPGGTRAWAGTWTPRTCTTTTTTSMPSDRSGKARISSRAST
jgi:hypothetical protein